MPRLQLAVGIALLGLVSWLAPASAGEPPGSGPGRGDLRHDPFAVGAGPLVPLPRADRTPVVLPPVYLAPPPGFRPLPRGTPIAPTAGYRLPGTGQVWIPARTDVVVGLDASGRVVHILEHTPGHFR